MPDYTDAFLAPLATFERETRATADVDAMGQFAPYWRDKLIALRVYIIACLENMKNGEGDIYSAKLKEYRREFDATLAAAQAASAGTPIAGGGSVVMERA